MKKTLNYARSVLLLLAFSFALIGCSNEAFDLQEESLKSDNSELSARNGTQYHFKTSLKGYANDSKAVGQATITISKDMSKIHYKLIVANIENVIQSHFHMAPPGENGGVVAFLFGPNPQPSGPSNGVLAEGYITAENVIGALDGDLDALINAIRNGNIYINVHTSAYPGGEIRGWL